MTIYRADRVVVNIGDRGQWLSRRRRNIGASDAGALFHTHPYKTAVQLWAQHSGRLAPDDIEDSDALRRGRILEPAVAAALREAHPEWVIEAPHQYYELTGPRLGATPDFFGWPSREAHSRGEGLFLIQVKTVLEDKYEAEWTPSPPANFLVQAQAEMLVTGIRRNVLAVMVLDNRKFPVFEYAFEADGFFAEQLEEAAGKFWECVRDGREPRLKLPQDGETMAKLYPDGDGSTALFHGDSAFVDACQAYKLAAQAVKDAEKAKEAAAGRIKAKLRNHSRGEGQGWRANWTSIPACTVVQNRQAHRRLTVTREK